MQGRLCVFYIIVKDIDVLKKKSVSSVRIMSCEKPKRKKKGQSMYQHITLCYFIISLSWQIGRQLHAILIRSFSH